MAILAISYLVLCIVEINIVRLREGFERGDIFSIHLRHILGIAQRFNVYILVAKFQLIPFFLYNYFLASTKEFKTNHLLY